MHVRVRRDAHEQYVLSKVYEKLQPLAPYLTVQVSLIIFCLHLNIGVLCMNFTYISWILITWLIILNKITKDDFGRPFGNFHILRDLEIPLTQVTVGHSELSPIPKTIGNMSSHLIYSTISKMDPVEEIRRSSNSQSTILLDASIASSNQIPWRNAINYNSSAGHNESREISVHGTNHLTAPTSITSSSSYVGNNGRHNIHSPFVTNNPPGNGNPSNQNLLLTSANFFAEES